MERSAVYRRAMAPVMAVTGLIGMVAALAGWKAGIAAPGAFVVYWLGVAVVALTAGVLLIRRQALQQSEPFWSPPTRRVSRAMLPALFGGFILGLIALLGGAETTHGAYALMVGLPLAWVILYGCAVHAAGFFMRRGIRMFGWIILLLGCAGFLLDRPGSGNGLVDLGYGIMGVVFGLLHLLYGLYLFATEKRSPAE